MNRLIDHARNDLEQCQPSVPLHSPCRGARPCHPRRRVRVMSAASTLHPNGRMLIATMRRSTRIGGPAAGSPRSGKGSIKRSDNLSREHCHEHDQQAGRATGAIPTWPLITRVTRSRSPTTQQLTVSRSICAGPDQCGAGRPRCRRRCRASCRRSNTEGARLRLSLGRPPAVVSQASDRVKSLRCTAAGPRAMPISPSYRVGRMAKARKQRRRW